MKKTLIWNGLLKHMSVNIMRFPFCGKVIQFTFAQYSCMCFGIWFRIMCVKKIEKMWTKKKRKKNLATQSKQKNRKLNKKNRKKKYKKWWNHKKKDANNRNWQGSRKILSHLWVNQRTSRMKSSMWRNKNHKKCHAADPDLLSSNLVQVMRIILTLRISFSLGVAITKFLF